MILRDPFYISSSLSPAIKLPNGTELVYNAHRFVLENPDGWVEIKDYNPGPMHNLQMQFADIIEFMRYAIDTEDQDCFTKEEYKMFKDCNTDDLFLISLQLEETENLIEE